MLTLQNPSWLSRGIVVIWRKGLGQITYMHVNRQVCFGVFSLFLGPIWILGVLYASTNALRCRMLWESIDHVFSLGPPLLLVGDFNCILHSSDEKRGRPASFILLTKKEVDPLGWIGTLENFVLAFKTQVWSIWALMALLSCFLIREGPSFT